MRIYYQLVLGIGQTSNPNRFQISDQGNNFDLAIDWSKIVELTDTLGNRNYTIAVRDEENAPYTFHNLIVGKTPDGDLKRPYLLTYVMSDEFKLIYD